MHEVEIRARVSLRKQLGQEPTPAEISKAIHSGKKFQSVTVEEIIQAYAEGKEVCRPFCHRRVSLLTMVQRVYTWRFECVGYDAEFQTELVKKYWTFKSQWSTGNA